MIIFKVNRHLKKLELEVTTYTLHFSFTARTSRDTMTDRTVWFMHLKSGKKTGMGEAAPIARLSPEDLGLMDSELAELKGKLSDRTRPVTVSECYETAEQLVGMDFPSIRFGLETALLDLIGGGRKVLFENGFSIGKKGLPINGLVWMDTKKKMIRQVHEKLDAGFDCIKLKIGALDFDEEMEVIDHLRSRSSEVVIRLDANGAFSTNEVLGKLKQLAEFDIHSIEQPIAPRQGVAMRLLTDKSPIPITLDEELIGVKDKKDLLESLNPQYVVLKPTLLGGFKQTADWISVAESLGINWWITSYLESNIGLNAIAQFAGNYDITLPQGLGTGGLYENNLDSRLKIERGKLWPK